MNFHQLLSYLDAILYSVLAFFAIIGIRKVNKEWIPFFLFLIFTAFLQDISIFKAMQRINNYGAIPWLIFVQIIALGSFYFFELSKKYWLIWGVVLVVLFGNLLNEWNEQLKLSEFTLFWQSLFVSSVILSLFSFFILVFKKIPLNSDKFLVHTGLFLYLSVGALVFLFGNYLQKMPIGLQTVIWEIHTIIHLVFLILVAISLWKIMKS